MLSPNAILQNRYRVVRQIGEGGMGAVYEAVDQRVSCVVAVKETLSERDGEARTAFEREAALLANLRHQALPKVMDYFSENDGDFLVMEFIPGYDLAELLDLRGGPFPQSQVLRWADDLLRVLEYLHGQEPPILHRDIKPSNLKLTKQGEVFLLDFGLAKGSLGQMPTLVTSRSVRGYTPIYAALEQIHGHGTDARSDLYSLGAALYHLLTGVAPIDAPARFHALEEDQPDPLPPVEKLNSQASSNVGAVIHQAMAVSRKQRPASAAVMRKALRNAAEEDERGAAEGEYRRAEAKRQQRVDERRGAAEEAETRKLEEARQREEEAARRAEDERQQKEEQERQQREEEERQRREAAEEAARRVAAAEESRKDEERKRQGAEEQRRHRAKEAEAEERRKQADEQARIDAEAKGISEAEEERIRVAEEEHLHADEVRHAEEARIAEDAGRAGAAAKRPTPIKTIPGPYIPARLPDNLEQSRDQDENDTRRYEARRERGAQEVGLPQPRPELSEPSLPVPAPYFWSKKRIGIVVAVVLVTIGVAAASMWFSPDGKKGSNPSNQQPAGQQSVVTNNPTTSQTSIQQPGVINKKVEQALSRGNTQRDAKHYEQAEKEYRRVLLLDSNEPRAYSGLGNVYYDQERYSEAIEQFKKSIELNPNSAETFYALGLTYLNTNDKAAAMSQYEALKNLKSDYASSLLTEINKH